MADKGYLKAGGHITIAGGEPCIAPEFNDLIQLFLDKKMENIRVLTNATKFSPIVQKGIEEGRINTVISVDSGTRETFIKVKRFDFYDIVWDNIKKYASVQKKPDSVKTKFILIPNINDTKEEIDKWIEKSIEAGVKHLAFDVEMFWFNDNKNNLPESIFNTFKYMINKINENNLGIELIDRGIILSKMIELK